MYLLSSFPFLLKTLPPGGHLVHYNIADGKHLWGHGSNPHFATYFFFTLVGHHNNNNNFAFNLIWPKTFTEGKWVLQYQTKTIGKQNVYNIAYSQAVTHPSTNATQCCLTSVIGRELVLST